jgi:transcriptional regulator with XRE-family HTH domain
MALVTSPLNDTTLGELIFLRRHELGLDQTQLGERCGASRQLIGKWERDLSVPDLWQAVRLADALNVDLRVMVALEPSIRRNRGRKVAREGSSRSRCSGAMPVAA